ncbi:hsc70-interacting protein 1-like [Rhagoletis pomonella]|uniref:hsc70-interacting protein 1-like n=1 Tax=Rhagoletis pomonella TaxID=28610 RepID=UPI001781EC42|nr:hsc70-interacting protein 1-like [Rhagoletis pomonella]
MLHSVIEADTEADQPMGDSNKTPSEEEIDQASDLRSQAAAAYSEQKFEEAIDLYTKAIELNPGNALFHAKRGQAFLKLKKPNACIRDCDKALELNCDSAAAYKFRGRAHRLLGNWEKAAKDLRQACKLDFDEEADEWLREVTPNAKKIEQHRIKQERKRAELESKKAQRRAHAHAKERQKQQQQQPQGPPKGFNPEFLSALNDKDFQEILADIAKNPANIEKHKNNPKFAKLQSMAKQLGMDNVFNMFGGLGGAAAGFGAGTGAATGAGAGAGSAGAAPTADEPKPEPKKREFVDDGLD